MAHSVEWSTYVVEDGDGNDDDDDDDDMVGDKTEQTRRLCDETDYVFGVGNRISFTVLVLCWLRRCELWCFYDDYR